MKGVVFINCYAPNVVRFGAFCAESIDFTSQRQWFSDWKTISILRYLQGESRQIFESCECTEDEFKSLDPVAGIEPRKLLDFDGVELTYSAPGMSDAISYSTTPSRASSLCIPLPPLAKPYDPARVLREQARRDLIEEKKRIERELGVPPIVYNGHEYCGEELTERLRYIGLKV